MVDKEEKQAQLEKYAVQKNGGMCQTYSYCSFCASPESVRGRTNTPCADALEEMKKNNRCY